MQRTSAVPIERVPHVPLGAAVEVVQLRADASSRPSLEGHAGFEDFYRTARPQVARALALTLRDTHLAVEAVDEAMTRAYARWDRVATFDNPGGWVYRVALNWATSVRRRKRPQPFAERGPTDVRAVPEPDVLAALAELGLGQRSVVVCRFYLGLSEEETATALGIRRGTAKSRLHRALRHLETRLDHLRPEELQ